MFLCDYVRVHNTAKNHAMQQDSFLSFVYSMTVVFALIYWMLILRLPFAATPYLLKLMLVCLSGNIFHKVWNQYSVQAVRALGDFVNFGVMTLIFYKVLGKVDLPALKILTGLMVVSELVRLLTEKGTMLLSALWQAMPHRSFAQFLKHRKHVSFLKSYVNYYILSDEKRLQKVLCWLKASARLRHKTQTLAKLSYVKSFRVVDDSVNLRAGNVRNVARGEIYVHANWSNNPYLLCGQALRRSPWIFDPRYLRRPFYYRTEANRLMTLFVFENARFCPLYAVYQFGHEIKSARYDVFYSFFRRVGLTLEQPVGSDGANNFDSLAQWIAQGYPQTYISRALWTDDEVIADLAGKAIPSALEIAERYTYPLVYVQDVLLRKITTR